MDHDDSSIGRILTRREALAAATRVGGFAMIAGLVSCRGSAQTSTQSSVHLIASPALTQGPFFVDEHLNRSDLTSGTNRASVIHGVPLLLTFNLDKLAGKEYAPMEGAHIDIWHTDAVGVYSDEDNPMNHENTARQTWLRGYQVTSDTGQVNFKTIIPGWYESRTPHIHFKVRRYDGAKATKEFTSQLFFTDDFADKIYANAPYNTRGPRHVRNADDDIYMERESDGSIAGKVLTLRPTKSGSGYTAEYSIVLTEGSLERTGQRRGRSR
jgi:protocatechuate 3,4-dioxygenase beta subunit